MSLVVRFEVEGMSYPTSKILFFLTIMESSFERKSFMLLTCIGNGREDRKEMLKRKNETMAHILISVS